MTTYQWQTQNWNSVVGDTHQLSDILCPPGSIQKTFTKSWSYQISVSSGPDLVSSNNIILFIYGKLTEEQNIPVEIITSFGLGGGFTYTWGYIKNSSY